MANCVLASCQIALHLAQTRTITNLSKLNEEEASLALELRLELKGEVNDHSVQMALREIGKRVVGLVVEDVRGG